MNWTELQPLLLAATGGMFVGWVLEWIFVDASARRIRERELMQLGKKLVLAKKEAETYRAQHAAVQEQYAAAQSELMALENQVAERESAPPLPAPPSNDGRVAMLERELRMAAKDRLALEKQIEFLRDSLQQTEALQKYTRDLETEVRELRAAKARTNGKPAVF